MSEPLDIRGDSFSGRYKRTNDYPIDTTEVWNTIKEAHVYARNTDTVEYVPYAGQVISVLENGAIYKLVQDETVPETDGRKHYKLAMIGSNNDNDDRYVRKDIAETIKFLMTFLEGINAKGVSTLEEIKLLKNIVSQNFSAGSTGFGITQDAQGNYHLDIDFVNIRRKLTVNEIQVQRSSYIGGKQWNTAAGIICSAVEDTGTAWRCRFKTTDADGRTVRNTFEKDDQALCETFNIETSGALDNRSYWRLVAGKGDDYIDLSKSDRDLSLNNDIPQAGDNIVQLGNRSDSSRQGAICWDSVTDGGPYVRVYKGINSYHMPQPNIDLNPEQSIIKAKLISEATGKDIDHTLEDMKVNLDLIKSQTDKEYTMWFFEYAPTLTNIPASEWNTDALKTMHEQDMFYNRATGLAYRFEKSGGTWVWNNITDHLTLKALENASKAQDTADGKRRVFVEQPMDAQAYDVGDMWVNATYPSTKPYTYQNDSLVCKTAKNAGSAFDIAHWQSSSTATTAFLTILGNRITAGVNDADDKIEEAKRLAGEGIADAKKIANTAIENISGAVTDIGDLKDRIDGVDDELTTFGTTIDITRKSIALLAEGKEVDKDGKVVQISKGGLVTTAYFNTLFSERVEFDEDGHIINTNKSGLVTTADFAQLFSERTEADGYVKRAEISTFITEDDAGRLISNATIEADKINLNGVVTANGYFKILKDGSMEATKGTFKGDIIQGNGINQMHADGSVSFANGKIKWGLDGKPIIEGKITTSVSGTRIEIDPETKSIRMYNQKDMEVGRISFTDEDWNGSLNSYPRIRLRTYHDTYMASELSLASGNITMSADMGENNYFCNLTPRNGLSFYKNNVQTQYYPANQE